MKRMTPLLLVGSLTLGACTQDAGEPLAPQAPGFSVASDADTERHVVVFRSGQPPAGYVQAIQEAGGRVEAAYDEIGVAVVSGLSADGVESLAASGNVGHVLPDLEIQWLDPVLEPRVAQALGADAAPASQDDPSLAFFFPRQWNLRAVGADRAWAAGRLGSPDVTVAILDSGIDYLHEDLAGLVDLSRSVSFVPSDDALVQTFFPGAHPIADLQFHGTHVAATVASNGLAAAGVTSRVTLVGVKVLGVEGTGPFSGVLAGIMYAADIGADVINLSLGAFFSKSGSPGFVSVLNRATNYASRNGATIVVAAGNESIDLDHIGNIDHAFCDSPNVVCVSATGPTGEESVNGPWTDIDAFAGYSNFGRSSIHVAAPGGNFSAVWAACSGFSLVVPVCQTGSFVLGLGGTSMATPHVAGLAALLVEDYGRNPGRIRQKLHQAADDLGQPGTDPFYGKGRINVPRALGVD